MTTTITERIIEAAKRRDAGIARSIAGVSDYWVTLAELAVYSKWRNGESFTANELWEGGLPAPESGNRRALGHVLRRLAKAGLIQAGGKSISVNGHGQAINVWEPVGWDVAA